MASIASKSLFLVPWRTATAVAVLSVAMFAFGYAMVPLYYTLCQALGIDTARPWVLAQTTNPPAPRALRVEFDANSHNTVIAMAPAKRITALDTGTAYSLTYQITNLTDTAIRGTAVPSFSPARAAKWFTKLQCFCFEELELAPHEILRAPVVFVLERDLPEDIETVALSYTFYPQDTAHHHNDAH